MTHAINCFYELEGFSKLLFVVFLQTMAVNSNIEDKRIEFHASSNKWIMKYLTYETALTKANYLQDRHLVSVFRIYYDILSSRKWSQIGLNSEY